MNFDSFSFETGKEKIYPQSPALFGTTLAIARTGKNERCNTWKERKKIIFILR